MLHRTLLTTTLCAAMLALAAGPATGDVIYEDVYYWTPDAFGGTEVLLNPAEPPVDALVKIQETVYDDQQGRQHLDLLMMIGAVHGDQVPRESFDLYVYAITNLNYAPAPPAGETGHGVAGYGVNLDPGVNLLGIWAPDYANVWWGGRPELALQYVVWNIDADNDFLRGDGWGVLPSQTFAGFIFAVPAGTPHSQEVPAALWSWTGEEPGGVLFGGITGMVSGPIPEIPEPATMFLLGLGVVGLVVRRRRK